MSIFKFITSTISNNLLPTHKRTGTITTWLISLLKPIQDVVDDNFDVFRPLKVEETKYNSQKIVFEQVINDHLGIVIAPFAFITTNSADTDMAFITNEDNNAFFISDNEAFADDYIGNAFTFSADANFDVFVPVAIFTALTTEEKEELEALIDKFKIAPMTHETKTF